MEHNYICESSCSILHSWKNLINECFNNVFEIWPLGEGIHERTLWIYKVFTKWTFGL